MDTYRLENANGLVLVVAPYGATITELHVPDRHGRMADIVHGYDSVAAYADGKSYFGATIGRVANRIAGARFDLDGQLYLLAMNDAGRGCHLHGGTRGWDRVVWSSEVVKAAGGAAVALTYVSPDGEEGYPGTVSASVLYTLTHDDELRIDMEATTDRTTLVNMAHHGYWNLGGTGSGTVLDHELTLFASHYTPGLPPTSGDPEPVAGTPFDFTRPKPIGADLRRAGGEPVGYDHNYLVDGDPGELRPAARVKDPGSGRVMALSTDQPGVQLYTSNFLDGRTSGKGASHTQYSAFCLESQKVPNAIHLPGRRDEAILKPGQTYRHRMVFHFTVE